MRLRVQRLPRPAPEEGTADDERLGAWLAGLVRDALARGTAGPVAVVIRDTRVELIALSGSGVDLDRFLAGLSASVVEGEPARAVGVAGRFLLRRAGDRVGAPVALAFLELPDCRWWSWRLLLDAEGRALPDGEQQTSASAGDALQPGLGRWWSLQRRTGIQVTFGPLVSDTIPESPHVH